MKKRRLLSLLLALAMLAGCAPASESPSSAPLPTVTATPAPTATPEPEPTATPEPVKVDFREFLDEVSAARRAVAAPEEPIEIPAEYVPDFYEQNNTFTEEEMELLLTVHGPKENLTRDDLIADAETFFTLLRTTYGAYYYFGGDDTFLPLLEAVKADLAAAENPTAKTLNDILYQRLSPILVDGHFQLGERAPRDAHTLYMYYVPDLYLDSLEGLENPDYIKPTIGPDGRICWWYAALSHDGSDLPDTLDGHTLKWQRAMESNSSSRTLAFSESEWEGIPILTSRRMHDGSIFGNAANAANAADQKALDNFSSCGGKYADSPLLIFDVRGNIGGDDSYVYSWFRDWTGINGFFQHGINSYRYTQISCRIWGNDYYPAEQMGTYHVRQIDQAWIDRSGPTFVLQDKNVASSGESVIELFRSAADILFVGGPTLGCVLTPNNISLYLPHSGLLCYFGTGLDLRTEENLDGVGYLPDLWVEPTQAMNLVKKLIQYYGLNTEQ